LRSVCSWILPSIEAYSTYNNIPNIYMLGIDNFAIKSDIFRRFFICKNILKKLSCYHDNHFRYFMFGKYNGFVSKARVSACMYFLVIYRNTPRYWEYFGVTWPAFTKASPTSAAILENRTGKALGTRLDKSIVENTLHHLLTDYYCFITALSYGYKFVIYIVITLTVLLWIHWF
jgi:hypothetical protein